MRMPFIAATFDRTQSRSLEPDEVMPTIGWLVQLATSDMHRCTASLPKFMSPATIKTPVRFELSALSMRCSWAWISVFFKASDLNRSLAWGVLPGTALDFSVESYDPLMMCKFTTYTDRQESPH